ncbi:MAG: carbohydrate ABC transporter permease [Chloroflexi bacterium HGW-Chloroflexi-1]|nr:MAG: carbohydrate ABC transporter permease [Chloroflexi bacterium HGW-Chloroflexi-1]
MTSAESSLANTRSGSRVPPKRRKRIPARTVVMHAIIIFFCLLVLVPLLWVLLTSVKSLRDAYTGKLWPEVFDFTHYTYVFQKMPSVLRNFANSIIVTVATVIVTTVIAILAGYALAHLRLPGAAVVGAVLLGTLFFPTRLVSIIGIFQIQRHLGLIDTLPGLILPYITLNLALSIMIMRGIFQQVSPELVDAARVDGASSWRTLIQIMLPLAANGVVVLGIVNFVTAWGEFLLAYTLTNDRFTRTFPVVLATTFGGFGEWAFPRVAAMYIMAILPGILAFTFLQRWYMKGLQEGALKF